MLEEHPSLRDKTMKLGQIARMCSVYGVDIVLVFRDSRGRGESGLIRRVLEFLETPQYLRRRLYPLDESLRFAGLLPPLRIPSHKPKLPMNRLASGEIREGVVLSGGSSVDIGLDQPVVLRQRLGENKRVTVKITSTSPLAGKVVERSEVMQYWGYRVEVCGIDQALADRRFLLKVATSRLGDPLARRFSEVQTSFARSRSVLALFGSPSRGLFAMTKNLRQTADFVLNLFPEQNTVTIRTEEAIASSLYLFEVLAVLGNTKV